jgi:hypothetical protein
MVIVYLKNGEKAPLPDADYVRLEHMDDSRGLVLRCLFGEQEVGQFKWEEVAGYSIAARPTPPMSADGFEAWSRRLSA